MGSLIFLKMVEKIGWRQCWGRRKLMPLTSSVQLCHTKGILEVGTFYALFLGRQENISCGSLGIL